MYFSLSKKMPLLCKQYWAKQNYINKFQHISQRNAFIFIKSGKLLDFDKFVDLLVLKHPLSSESSMFTLYILSDFSKLSVKTNQIGKIE